MKHALLVLIALFFSMASFAISPITGSLTICVGSSTSLTDATPGGTWSTTASTITVGSGSGIITGVMAGTGVVTYSVGSAIATATVTVNPLPLPITGATTVCIGAYITLMDATPGGMWSSSSVAVATVGSATGLLYGVSAGIALITYSLATGCYTTGSVTVNSCPLLGIPQTRAAEQNITIFPNPANDILTISTVSGDYSSYVISNQVEQVVMHSRITGTQTSVDINTLPAGIYYITLHGTAGITVLKFMKE